MEKELQEFHTGYKKDFEKEISPKIAELEKQRKTKHKLAIFLCLITNIIAIAFIAYILQSALTDKSSVYIPILGAIILLLAAQTPLYAAKKNYTKSVSDEYINTIIPFKNIEASKKSYISDEELRTSGIVNEFSDRVNSINYIADYKSTKVAISETTMANDSTFTFKGVLIKIAPTCEYTGKTIIVPPSAKITHLQEINQNEFENEYKIYSTSQTDAEEIISPTFLTALNELKKVYNATTIKVAIQGTEVFISISTSEIEDISNTINLCKPLDAKAQNDILLNQFNSIFKLVNEINLQ